MQLEEGDEYKNKYHAVPIALEADFDVAQSCDIDRLRSFETFELTDDEDFENTAFLSGEGAAAKRRPIPQSDFGPQDRDIMLQKHDGVDVFAQEWLRNWQLKAIEKVFGTQPKLTTDGGLKGAKRLTPS